MSNLIIQPPDNTLEFLKQSNNTLVNFLQLGQGQSEAVQAGVVQSGEFFLSSQKKEKSIPVGSFARSGGEVRGSIDLMFGLWRPKALLMVDGSVVTQSFNYRSPVFKKIQSTEQVKPSEGVKAVSPLWGTEVLVFIPPYMFDFNKMLANPRTPYVAADIPILEEHYKKGCLATFSFLSKTNRQNTLAGEYETGEIITLMSKLVSTKTFQFWTTPDRSKITIPDNIENSEKRRMFEEGRKQINEASQVFLSAMNEDEVEVVAIQESKPIER